MRFSRLTLSAVGFLLLFPVLAAGGARTADAGSSGVVDGGPRWTVDWSRGMVSAWGEQTMVADAPNAASARRVALEAAEKAALVSLVEAARAVRLSSEATVGAAVAQDSASAARMGAILRAAPLIGTPPASADTTVRVTVGIPINGAFLDAALPESGFDAGAPRDFPPPSRADAFTGLIVETRGLAAAPALLPRLLDARGVALFGPGSVNREYVVEQGMAGYAASVEAARGDPRVGERPLVVRAVRAAGALRADLVLAGSDARRVRRAISGFDFLRQCRVIIVLD